MQRHVLYLGEINDSQRAAWQKAIAVFDEHDGQTRQCAIFPDDRSPAATDTPAVQVRFNQLQLSRPRTWGACWLGDQLWRDLDTFFAPLLGVMEMLARATAVEIAAPLRSGGLYRHKSKLIKQICTRLIGLFGHPTLAPLKAWTDEHCETFLTSLPGVGLKVARCVLLYSFDRAVFPVDTHCWRVCRRLGWVRASSKSGGCTKADMDRLQRKIGSPLFSVEWLVVCGHDP